MTLPSAVPLFQSHGCLSSWLPVYRRPKYVLLRSSRRRNTVGAHRKHTKGLLISTKSTIRKRYLLSCDLSTIGSDFREWVNESTPYTCDDTKLTVKSSGRVYVTSCQPIEQSPLCLICLSLLLTFGPNRHPRPQYPFTKKKEEEKLLRQNTIFTPSPRP